MELKGIIFDIDGTLVDSNDQHTLSFQEAFELKGYKVSYSRIRRLIGIGAEKLIPIALKKNITEEEISCITNSKKEIFHKKYLKNIHSFPKVKELLLLLKSFDLKIGIATSANEEDVKPLLQIAKVEEIIDKITSSKDATRSKPDPDIVLACINKLKIAPANLLMVGDTPYDIMAALGAGIRSIGFTCGGWTRSVFVVPSKIFDGPWDLYSQLLSNSSDFNKVLLQDRFFTSR